MSIINHLFEAPHSVVKHLNAPLLKEREQYLSFLKANGRNKIRLQAVAGFLLHISRALGPDGLRPVALDEVRAAGRRWAMEPARGKSQPPRNRAYANYVGLASAWLKHLNSLTPLRDSIHPYRECLNEFERTLALDLRLSPSTVKTRYLQVAQFLRWLFESEVNLSDVTLHHTDLYLQHLEVRRLARASVATATNALRAFFRYAARRKLCRDGIALGILSINHRSFGRGRRGPSWDDVGRLLGRLTDSDPMTLRDKAMAMLFAIYGLRCIEVAGLLVTDIDFEAEIMTVRRAKREGIQRFPLRRDVGIAIRNYIAFGRPNCRVPNVFVTAFTPYRKPTNASFYNRVAKMFTRAGVVSAQRGPHSLRHACASRLLSRGSSLREISAFLGHNRLQSVRAYVHYSLDDLRRVTTLRVDAAL
jgi:integrase/recombinase XerD